MQVDSEAISNKKILTARQLEVLRLFEMGYDRKQVAKSLYPPVVVQAIHQIVLRIRKRLKERQGMTAKKHALDAMIKEARKKRTAKRILVTKEEIKTKCHWCSRMLSLSSRQKIARAHGQSFFFHRKCSISYKIDLNNKFDDFYNKQKELKRLVV